MPERCLQELCPNWSGDGRVCPCALFDLDPPRSACPEGDGLCETDDERHHREYGMELDPHLAATQAGWLCWKCGEEVAGVRGA